MLMFVCLGFGILKFESLCLNDLVGFMMFGYVVRVCVYVDWEDSCMNLGC